MSQSSYWEESVTCLLTQNTMSFFLMFYFQVSFPLGDGEYTRCYYKNPVFQNKNWHELKNTSVLIGTAGWDIQNEDYLINYTDMGDNLAFYCLPI